MGIGPSVSDKGSLFECKAKTISGEEILLDKFKGSKAIIVVNVASSCGYTDVHYNQLNELYKKYHSQGLEILGFPCNQFLFQENGSEQNISSFCEKRKVEFPLFSKIKVNGSEEHEVYAFLKSKFQGMIRWNFTKFLVNAEGQPILRVSADTSPFQMEDDIKKLLN